MNPIWQSEFKKSVAHTLAQTLESVFKIDALPADPKSKTQDKSLEASVLRLLVVPPEFKMGQLAFPCFQLAKSLKLGPPQIAQKIVEALQNNPQALIAKAQIAGAYVNFFLNFEASSQKYSENIKSEKYFAELSLNKREQIDLEYMQPNTHKALHLGHMRNLFYGDAVCNLLDRIGNNVIRTTYPGDLGTHIAKVLWYLKKIPRDSWPTEHKATWLGHQYAEATQKIEALEEAAKTQAQKEIQDILAHLQENKGDDYALYLETREWSLDEMKRVYAWSNSHFHKWYFESECDVPSRELVKELASKGVFQKSEGAIGLHLGDELGFALLLKSDGNGLYLTKDIELIKRKFSDPKTERAIYIVDSRQKLHFKQLFKVAEAMGFEQAKKSEHLSYENVNDESGNAFSSRDSRGLSLEQLRTQIEDIVKREYMERHKGEWTDAEIDESSEKITLAALKYGMLRIDPLSPIKFILSQWIALEGETGPYLQYVFTRCQSILSKAEKAPSEFNVSSMTFEKSEEEELFYTLYRYNEIVEAAALDYRPNHLANYVYDIAKLFNRFYKECSVLGSEGKTRESRLQLVWLTQKIISDAFGLLNLPLIKRM